MVSFSDPLDDDFPLGDGVVEGSVEAACPYCGEVVEVLVDPGGGEQQQYVEDCEVCCRPWRVTLRWNGETPSVELAREDD